MKNVVITGTSRGIGFEMVKLFADAGYQVLALSRNTASVEALGYSNVHSFTFDLSKDESFDTLSEFVASTWDSKVDVLINNAGAIVNKPFKDISQDEFLKVYQVNVFGVAKTIQTLLPFMNTNSHVVSVSSMGGIQGSMKFLGLAAYSSSKGAIITLSELLAEEYKDNGPSFNVLALGAVQTEMLQEAFPGYKAPILPEEMASYIKEFALTGAKFYNGKVLEVSSTTP
ncbi:NAD(P)-dependent dehydrogenase, short-chain alcohol dehydrogenase family [Pustulibacterium marinum]|uniref:NAD(P)-dependent dehydrogenase, short-chain alcohol dehydrogenase family n=1 Tax=Pustulibacterium marinum TaxID=1224947 RepID=A0A1I7F500_9FLAO|nr:SDR family oxidoreductase [Pustulibacterium marinum]SFU31185.1 NAD(P)-dependent dehydrogenase, short-chain alcohol dehydrogenase family [Pustulibacterium marinum]